MTPKPRFDIIWYTQYLQDMKNWLC
jgi:hypothetical protein